MSTAAPNPKNLMLLAGLGIGVYWLFSRRAMAATAAAGPARQGVSNPYRQDGLVGLINGVSNLLRPPASVGTYDGRAAMPWNTTPVAGGPSFNNPSAYVAPIATSDVDGLAFNPPSQAVYDYLSDLQAQNIL